MTRRLTLAAALLAASLAAGAPDGRRWWSHVLYLADDKWKAATRAARPSRGHGICGGRI